MSTTNAKQGHPKGLYMLFMVEMWERFSFYGMRALLTLFMVSAVVGFDRKTAMSVYSWFLALVYLTPVIGGYLADNYIGKRHSVTIGAILMAAGQFTLASYGFIPVKVALFAGLTLIVLGNGFFKPTISSLVGDLYEPNDSRRDSGFTIFYMGINVGAFIAPFITGFLGEQSRVTAASWVQWKYGFLAAGIGLVIGLIWYLVSQKKYLGEIGLYPAKHKKSNVAATADKPLTKEEKDRIKAIFIFTFFAIFFFAFFEQAGSSLTMITNDYVNRMITNPFTGRLFEVPTSWFQSANPIFVVMLAPLFSKLWITMGRRNKEPETAVKFGWGLFLLGIGYLVIAWGASYLTGGKISMMWVLAMYFLHTTGELCLSPVGLSLMTKLSPAKYVSMFIGVWFIGTTLGNKLSGTLAGMMEQMSTVKFLLMPAACSIFFAILIWFLAKNIKKWMHGVQ